MCIGSKSKRSSEERVQDIYVEIGNQFGYTYRSLKRFASFADAIDRLQKIRPDIATDILNGDTRITVRNAIILSKRDPANIGIIFDRIACEKTPVSQIFIEQQDKSKRRGRPRKKVDEAARISVKDNPTYNPDAQVNALSYTIPSWISMVEKTFAHSDFYDMSLTARDRLSEELNRLINTAESVVALLVEVK